MTLAQSTPGLYQTGVACAREVMASEPSPVPVWAVGLACTIGALASGLGALPFCVWRTWRKFDGPGGRRWAGLANGIAAGVMIAASYDMVGEARRDERGAANAVLGLALGAVFIVASQYCMGEAHDEAILSLIGTDEKPGELMVLLKKLDEQLAASTWLAGEQLTIADCQMIPRLVHLSTGIMDHIPTTILDTFANIKTYMANFQAIPQVKAFYDDLETKKKAAEEATKEQK